MLCSVIDAPAPPTVLVIPTSAQVLGPVSIDLCICTVAMTVYTDPCQPPTDSKHNTLVGT